MKRDEPAQRQVLMKPSALKLIKDILSDLEWSAVTKRETKTLLQSHVYVSPWTIYQLCAILMWNCNREWTLNTVNAATEPMSARGGDRGVPRGATTPPIFAWPPPVPLPNFFRFLSESPTQTIDSSPCGKTGPSSGPPKWKCLAPPLMSTSKHL